MDGNDKVSRLHLYYKEKLRSKEIEMKIYLEKIKQDITTRESDKTVLRRRDSEKAFDDLAKLNLPHRIIGLYSYNLLDNPDYILCQKIEKKILKFDIKTKKKQLKKLATEEHAAPYRPLKSPINSQAPRSPINS